MHCSTHRGVRAGEHEAAEREPEIPAQSAERDRGAEILRGEPGEGRARQDHQAPAVILAAQDGVRERTLLAGGAHPPLGVGEGPGVNELDRRVEEVGSLEEERPLLGIEQREALIHGDLGDVRFHLREVRLDGRIDRAPGGGIPLGVGTEIAVGLGAERRAPVVAMAQVRPGGVGRQDHVVG